MYFNQWSQFANICLAHTKNPNASGHSLGLSTSCQTYPSWQRILTGPAHVEWLRVNDFSPKEYHVWHAWTSTCWHVETSHQNMKHQSSMRRRLITGRSERTARVSQRMDWRIGVIKFYVSANNKKDCNIDHVSCMWVICYLCVELKLKINTRSPSNQTLKSAHPYLLSSRCWPWGASSWLASRDLGTASSSYLAGVWGLGGRGGVGVWEGRGGDGIWSRSIKHTLQAIPVSDTSTHPSCI